MEPTWRSGLPQCALCLACALLIGLGWPLSAGAHELEIDQLTLWPDATTGTLHGQMLFDPALTRPDGSPADQNAERAALRFLAEHLVIEANGEALKLDFEVRELWVPGGATPGDSVMLKAMVPTAPVRFRVRAPSAISKLLLVVETRTGPGKQFQTLVSGGDFSPPFELGGRGQELENETREADRFTSAWNYVVVGFEHILPAGLDHVLFVTGLVLGSRRRWKPLVLQLSAFTLAHTLTLALGTLGWVSLPGRWVESAIALSIAFVAIENLLFEQHRGRALVALSFGLLHGLGFAGALSSAGITREGLWLPLLCFNVGVELGQLAVVLLLLVLFLPIREPTTFRRYVVRPGSVLVAGFGLFWVVERVFFYSP